jgi:hypothetical protein
MATKRATTVSARKEAMIQPSKPRVFIDLSNEGP